MSDKKNVVVIINTLSKGGAEKQAVILANLLSKYHNVSLLVLDNTFSSNELIGEISDEVEKIFFNGINLKNLKKILNHKAIINSHVIFSSLARSNFVSSVIKIFNRKKIVYGGIRNCRLKKGKKIIESFIHKYIHDYTIFNNYKGMNYLVKNKGFINTKSVCIHNCINVNIPDKCDDLNFNENEKVTIVTLSRFVAQKDLKTSIKAVHYLLYKLNTKNIEVIIGGFGPQKNCIESLIVKNKLKNYVKVNENPNVYKHFCDADIFLSTSLIEGLSNSILEAMTFKLPIVATNVGDNNYMVKNSINGFLCEVGDYEGLALKLEKLVGNKCLRHNFGNSSYEIVKKNFNQEKFLKKYLELINA